MGKAMNCQKLPSIDSIEKLAQFWDSHDLTDFEDELEEVREPVFEREDVLQVPLGPTEIEAVRRLPSQKAWRASL